uniref:NADH-ubiquinone oxidoreductase chain 6 n=1 Tax=Bacillus atticus TaxID=36825 RepID=E2DHY5_9NEOP|nr:NADH dehydrogenase subunit 6 [Bacillus atticus]
MKLMLTLNMMMNMMFLMMKHPMSMGMIIILQTTLIAMMTGMMYKSFWFSYILFMMFIGGMMVLFIYMTSLMPNMLFSMSFKSMFTIIIITMIMLITKKKLMINNNDMELMTMNNTMLMKMYNYPVNISLIMMASYLLFTMITVFKITESYKGPLRMMIN